MHTSIDESLNMTTMDTAQQSPRHIPPRAKNRRRSRGQNMVEFAIVVPIMLGMLLIAGDFGRAFTAYLTVSSAAREGAVYASRSSDNANNTAEIQNRVRTEVGSGGTIWGQPLDIPTPVQGTDPQTYPFVEVTVNYTFKPLFAIWPIPPEMDMSRTVRMRILGN